MFRIAAPLVGVLTLTTAWGAAAANGEADPGAAVRRALAAQGPVVSAADNARITAWCGPSSATRPRNLRFSDGALICPDGREVRNAETREMSVRIAARAKAHVRVAMDDPSVKAAIRTVADEKVRAALREAGAATR